MYFLGLCLFGVTMFFVSMCQSMDNGEHIKMYDIMSYLSKTQVGMLFFGLSALVPIGIFFLFLLYKDNVNNSIDM